MKRLLILSILSLGIILGLCSCGNNINSDTLSTNSCEIVEVTLSTNSCEIVEDKTFKLSYAVIPENANVDGLIWTSVDENIATVDTDGTITALSVGQTSITVSDGKKVFATCSVTVLEKPAYERLNEDEKAFVDCIVSNIDYFVKPDSIEVTGIQFIPGDDIEDFWSVEIKGETTLGTSTSDLYFLNQTYGFSECPFPNFIFSDTNYRLYLINKAIDEKR